jgi:hypothetical protein
MTAEDRLAEVFHRGLRVGVEALSSADLELFRIREFIIDSEMGGLSGYFYNRLPELTGIFATVAAMRRFNLVELSDLLREAVELFTGYIDPDPPCTWGEVLRQYDPSDRLTSLDRRIRALADYGLADSTIG